MEGDTHVTSQRPSAGHTRKRTSPILSDKEKEELICPQTHSWEGVPRQLPQAP